VSSQSGLECPHSNDCSHIQRGHNLLTILTRRKNAMSDEHISAPSNVVPLRAPSASAAKSRSERKWGKAVMDCSGFCILPSLLLRAQRRLGLSATQLALVIQLIDFWWTEDQIPWPTKETIGQRLNLSDKQIQRLVRGLEERGYVKRVVRKTRHGRTSNGYDMAGLVQKLQELAPEFAEAANAKKKVERRGGLKKADGRSAHEPMLNVS
jgi:predicted transcriptional regulator